MLMTYIPIYTYADAVFALKANNTVGCLPWKARPPPPLSRKVIWVGSDMTLGRYPRFTYKDTLVVILISTHAKWADHGQKGHFQRQPFQVCLPHKLKVLIELKHEGILTILTIVFTCVLHCVESHHLTCRMRTSLAEGSVPAQDEKKEWILKNRFLQNICK